MSKKQLLSDYKFYSGYAKYIDSLKRRETWDESVERVMQMHKIKYANVMTPELKEAMDYAEQAYKDKLVLASQRSLQFGGDSILKHEMKMYNCLTSYVDRIEFFKECMYNLLCGCGVGFSVQLNHISLLPDFMVRNKGVKTFVIQDSIEGWADAIGVLMASYTHTDEQFKEYWGYRVDFDYSLIRPKGALISGGFKAPGPDGLRKAIIKIESVIDKALREFVVVFGSESYIKLRSIQAYDIIMHMSDAVLSGGVRRSATICLFSPEDNEMLNAKTGDWFNENPQRARSNNSVLLIRNKTTKEQFHEIMQSVKDWGEPGFVWSDSEDIIFNPCVEIGMTPYYIDNQGNKISGWQGCNLTEINGAACTNVQDFFRACQASAILGTLQAGYTDFKYVNDITKKIFDREALLGCSITGLMNNPDILLNPTIQREGAELIKAINKQIATLLGINQAARTTCIKPSGNASVLLGTASGIHGEHSKRYFRNVQTNKEEDLGKYIKEYNPYMVEESVWSANKSDYIISFPVETSPNSIFKNDLLDEKLLEKVKLTQQNWVESGTNVKLCVNPLTRHNVSNTILVKNWDNVENYIYENREWFAGISLLSYSGDKDFNQAPFQEVLTEQEIFNKYGLASLFASGLIVDGLHAFGDLWTACDTVLLNIGIDKNQNEHVLKLDWIKRLKKFASNYFKKDLNEAVYCLKDVHLLHKWTKINQNFKKVNFETLNIKPKYTNIDELGAIACNGDQCEINF